MPDIKIQNIHTQNFESMIKKTKEFKGKVANLKTIGGFKTRDGKLVRDQRYRKRR